MRLTTTSATFVLAFAALVSAAPANYEQTSISKRDAQRITDVIESIQVFQAKRSSYVDAGELATREYAIVTDILSALNDTELAPKIIQGLIDNTTLQPLVTDATVAIIKSGLINLTTLFTALNDSGLAAKVIQDLISDCTFYAAIYQLAINEISGFLLKFTAAKSSTKREIVEVEPVAELAARDDSDSVVNNLLESLAQSGLASSVVRQLIVDPAFLKYGASLIQTLLQDNLIDFSALISALKDSGLVTSLFKEFFTLLTLQTVITNALAAAAGDCGTPTGTATAPVTTPTRSATATVTTPTSTTTSKPNGSCRKKRRAY